MKLSHSERRLASLLLGWIEPDANEAAPRIDLPSSHGIERASDPRSQSREAPPECGGSIASLPPRPRGPSGLLWAAAVPSTVDELLPLPARRKAPRPARRAQFGRSRSWAWRAFCGRACSLRAPSPLSYL